MNAATRLTQLREKAIPGPWFISRAACRCCWIGPESDPKAFEAPDTEDGRSPSAELVVSLVNATPQLIALIRLLTERQTFGNLQMGGMFLEQCRMHAEMCPMGSSCDLCLLADALDAALADLDLALGGGE